MELFLCATTTGQICEVTIFSVQYGDINDIGDRQGATFEGTSVDPLDKYKYIE